MQALAVIVAFWLIVIGIYGFVSLYRERGDVNPIGRPGRGRLSSGRPRSESFNPVPTISTIVRPARLAERATTTPVASRRAARPEPRRATREQAAPQPSYSEVDYLRAQVLHLRSELVALAGSPVPLERPRLRRYQTGFYTHLPRPLRQQVQEVRNVRHPAA